MEVGEEVAVDTEAVVVEVVEGPATLAVVVAVGVFNKLEIL